MKFSCLQQMAHSLINREIQKKINLQKHAQNKANFNNQNPNEKSFQKMYLKYLHQECLDRFALIQNSLTAYFKTANLFGIDLILLKERGHSCQTVKEEYFRKIHIVGIPNTTTKPRIQISKWGSLIQFVKLIHINLDQQKHQFCKKSTSMMTSINHEFQKFLDAAGNGESNSN